MAYLYDGEVRKSASPIGALDEIRAAELWKNGQRRDARSRRLFAAYEAANPEGAKVAKRYAELTHHEHEQAAIAADAIIKGRAMCLKCHAMMKRTQVRCGQCGKKNPHFIAKKVSSVGKKRKKAFKGISPALVKSAVHSAATGGAYSGTDVGEAKHTMWLQYADSPDPVTAQAARDFLEGRTTLLRK